MQFTLAIRRIFKREARQQNSPGSENQSTFAPSQQPSQTRHFNASSASPSTVPAHTYHRQAYNRCPHQRPIHRGCPRANKRFQAANKQLPTPPQHSSIGRSSDIIPKMASPPIKSTFTYKTDPSAGAIPAHVYYAAASASSSPRPIAIVFHAGGFTVGTAAMVPATEINALVRLGFVVVTPEYRLAPHVGVYEGPVADAKSVLTWAQDQLPAMLAEQAPGVVVDGSRVAVMGHSAGGSLALHLGSTEVQRRPVAVVDFYAPKDFQDEWASKPLGLFAKVPDLPKEFLDKAFQGPTQFATPPMIKDGKPDLSSPRNAWMITTLRDGTNTAAVIKDGNFQRADPVHQFHPHFPPTMFVHGTADVFVPDYVSRRAHEKLTSLGVRSQIVEATGAAHVFDFAITEEDPLFKEKVIPALEFMAREAGLKA
jgi:acetyl esterase/lipase